GLHFGAGHVAYELDRSVWILGVFGYAKLPPADRTDRLIARVFTVRERRDVKLVGNGRDLPVLVGGLGGSVSVRPVAHERSVARLEDVAGVLFLVAGHALGR